MAKQKTLYICPKAKECKFKDGDCGHEAAHEKGGCCDGECEKSPNLKHAGPCIVVGKSVKPKQKTLGELLMWAKRFALDIRFYGNKEKIMVADGSDFVLGRSLLSALRAAYREWSGK